MKIEKNLEKLALFIATGFGTGLFKKAPGTMGSVAAGLLYLLINFIWQVDLALGVLIALAYSIASILLCNCLLETAKYRDVKDPKEFVIDEFAGLYVALIGISPSIINIAICLVLFRIFDISKVLGAKKLEKLPKGYGITLDDLLAGLYANLLARLIISFI